MKTMCDYRVLICEGGDQVGKADAVLGLSNRLLLEGIQITYSSFPIYATPWGALVRYSLKEGLGRFSFSNPLDELKVRVSLYAINRLEFMEVLLSNRKYKDTLILLDRSPFSVAVAIGYGLTTAEKFNDMEEIDELVKYFLELEKFMIKKMALKNCVVQLSSQDRDWKNLRVKKGDMFERKDVQDAAEQVYQVYADNVKEGWKKVITKTAKGWRDKKEIQEEIYDFLLERLGVPRKKKVGTIYDVRYEIGVEEILNNIYRGEELPSGILTKYLKALRSNDKDMMYKYAYAIGDATGKTCKSIVFRNKGVKKAIKGIMDEVPKVFDIASEIMSSDFSDKFYGAVNE